VYVTGVGVINLKLVGSAISVQEYVYETAAVTGLACVAGA
jgi:hypothetical protein